MTSTLELPPAFTVDLRPDRERVLVRPAGELDLLTVPQLAAAVDELIAAGFRALHLDLRDLTFMDSTGLRFVAGLARRTGADGLALTLTPGPPAVQRLFTITGLEEVLA